MATAAATISETFALRPREVERKRPVSQERIETARRLNMELAQCKREFEAVLASILARGAQDDIRKQFRAFRDTTMSLGRLLAVDGRFKWRLPNDVREAALSMLRSGSAPIAVQRQLGLDCNTVRRLRYRELHDYRNLRKLCKLNEQQVAEIRAAGTTVTRRHFAEKFNVSTRLITRARNSQTPYRQVAKMTAVGQIAKQPGPPSTQTTNELHLRINPALAQSLVEMSQLANCELAAHACELLETAAADFRLKKIPLNFLYLNDKTPPPEVNPRSRYRGMSAETSQRIIHLRFAEGLSERVIAERLSLGESTVRRITSAYERAKQVEMRSAAHADG